MKLKMTLPERPGFLHALPILNIFALVQLFFVLGPSLMLRSGVVVETAPSRFQIERYQDALVVTLGQGESGPHIHFGRDAVTMTQLAERLDKLRADGAPAKAMLLLQSDVGSSVGVEREVTELALDRGFRVALVGKNPPTAATPKPSNSR